MAADAEDLIKRLLKKREGYEECLTWEKFLLDAYAGTGGFQGAVRQPLAGFWGAGAGIYSVTTASRPDESEIDTYIDRYPREDVLKFQRRAALANYSNPVEPVVDIRLSYLHRRPPIRLGHEPVEHFLADADGDGQSWDTLLHNVVHLRAEVLGWCPVLFDMPEGPEGPPLSRAQAQERGIKPYAIPLFPGQVYDWSVTRKRIAWAKIGTWREEQSDALGECVRVHEVAIWYPDRVETYEIVEVNGRQSVRNERVRANPWGVVPLLVCVHKPSQQPLRGMSAVGTIAKLAKRLLNYVSELDEHLRSSTFALLQVPTNEPDKLSGILGGSGNALPVRTDSSVEYKFLNPDTSIPVVYEKRIEATEKAIQRNAKNGAASANDTKQVQSGVSKAFDFENMNRSLADTAKHHAAFEQAALRLVARMDGVAEADIEKIISSPQTRFDVEELSAELENALAARSLPLGPTAIGEMTKRLVRQLLPNLEPAKLSQIDSEIDGQVVEAERARVAAAEQLSGQDDGDGQDAEDDADVADDAAETKAAPKKPAKGA